MPGPHVPGGGGGKGGQEDRIGGGEGGQEARVGGREAQGGQEAGGSEQSPRDHAAGAGLGRPAQVRRRRPHLPLRRPQDRLGLHQGQRPPEPSEQEGDHLRREAQNHLSWEGHGSYDGGHQALVPSFREDYLRLSSGGPTLVLSAQGQRWNGRLLLRSLSKSRFY